MATIASVVSCAPTRASKNAPAPPSILPDEVIAFDASETAGISGFDWDKTDPNARIFDAIHRTVLLRFPGSADAIAAKATAGRTVSHAEIVLEFDGTDIGVPAGYAARTGMGAEKWSTNLPEWHVVAWGVYRPWIADAKLGPTLNAYISSAGFWSRFGATAPGVDRSAQPVATAELSSRANVAHLDVTALLHDPAYGAKGELGARLRALDEQGVLLRKLETYDYRYRSPGEVYEWSMPTGGFGVRFKSPRLLVTLSSSGSSRLDLPPKTDVRALAQSLASSKTGGAPTTVFPNDDEFRAIAARVKVQKPGWMPDWQWSRVRELWAVGGGNITDWANVFESADPAKYRRFIRDILSMPYRYWRGWDVQSDLMLWYLFRDALPAYVQDHIKHYWEACLMPDVSTSALVHPQSNEANSFWKSSADWRGNNSFFRAGYNYATSTMNFNHTAPMGALLGGAIIGSENAMADGRHGLIEYPLKLWSFFDGTTQESIDPYYLSITISGQKMFADFGPTVEDRLAGRILIDRSVEMLTSAYHPDLGRFVSSGGRTNIESLLLTEQGISSVLHTMSKKGVIRTIDHPYKSKTRGLPDWGQDFPPGRVALQSIATPWGDDWVTNAIDQKSLPYDLTATSTTRGTFDPPLWERIHLGRHYGLASQDLRIGTFEVVSQWNRRKGGSLGPSDLGSLTFRYAINEPDLVTTEGGAMPVQGGLATLQHKNRAIVCMKPRSEKDAIVSMAGGEKGLRSLAGVLGLFSLENEPSWEIWVDGKQVKKFPFKARTSQRIVIRDGVTYVAILPLPSKNLGRHDEVVIGFGGAGKTEGVPLRPALTIRSYNLQRAESSTAPIDWKSITEEGYGGFVVELADVEDYPSFAAFLAHVAKAKLEARWDAATAINAVRYESSGDVMEIGCSTKYRQLGSHVPVPAGEQTHAIPYRRVNGKWPYLAPGIDRDTDTVQQGTAGRLEKRGAVLLTEPKAIGFLEVEPVSGSVLALHPYPEPSPFVLQVPGGIRVTSEGLVGLTRVVVDAQKKKLTIDAAPPAKSFLIEGLGETPQIIVNGQTVTTFEKRTLPSSASAIVVRVPH